MIKRLKIRCKKAQIASTITWMAGFFIIFFVLIMYISMVTFLAKGKIMLWSGNKIQTEESGGIVSLEFQRALFVFLNTPVEFNGEKIDVKKLISGNLNENKEEKVDKFKEVAKTFIDINFPLPASGYYRTWIRVYNPEDKIDQYYYSENSDYSAESSSGAGSGGTYCDPFDESAAFSYIGLDNKKIAICAN
ncbi:MAG: hypothetical protein KKA64_01460 [Nanoarchaeota archaeon]|nr:hypothetical protein [Nanoarchaeota archaeon]